jgi:GTPase KRas protein
MRDHYMRTGQGFILVYSITSRNSFEEIAAFREQILRVKDKDSIPMILAGNKSDLEKDRQVTTTEGTELARSFGCPFFETSAKARVNVEDIFFQVVREVRKEISPKKDLKKKSKGSKFLNKIGIKSECLIF